MTTSTGTPILEAHRRLILARSARSDMVLRHQNEKAAAEAELEEAVRLLDLAKRGVSTDLAERAEAMLEIRGPERLTAQMVADAIADIVDGPEQLLVNQVAIKDYDRFRGQRCDSEYGYGPKHGRIVSAIGLTSGYRNELGESERVATELERELMIEYLGKLQVSGVAS